MEWRRFLRWLLIRLGIRRISPPDGGKRPGVGDLARVTLDTGGGGFYRPAHVEQDPNADPAEPTSESSQAGYDHGWANCTMASGAMALDYQTQGRLRKHGGHLRHKQGDLSGGTDLYDLRDAWAVYGETLTIRSGAGWGQVKEDRADGRMLVMQGSGNVPGSATFDGGHACAVSPETNSDGKWLFGDPLANDWQWVTESSIRDWCENWQTSIAWAASRGYDVDKPEPEPEPEPDTGGAEPPPDRYGEGLEAGYISGLQAGRTEALDEVFRSWRPGTSFPPDLSGVQWDDPPRWDVDDWVEAWPTPIIDLRDALLLPVWDSARWTATVWLDIGEPSPPARWSTEWDGVGWNAATD